MNQPSDSPSVRRDLFQHVTSRILEDLEHGSPPLAQTVERVQRRRFDPAPPAQRYLVPGCRRVAAMERGNGARLYGNDLDDLPPGARTRRVCPQRGDRFVSRR
jgi:hypothetical protein